MKKVILVRHGEALPTDLGSTDYERILSENGKHFVRVQGGKVKEYGWSIDHMITSAAIRTKQTGILLANELGFNKDLIHFEDQIYEAPISRLLDVFEKLDNNKQCLVWVGHNPGISHLHYYLTLDSFSFSPGNVSLLELEIEDWDSHFEACGTTIKTY